MGYELREKNRVRADIVELRSVQIRRHRKIGAGRAVKRIVSGQTELHANASFVSAPAHT